MFEHSNPKVLESITTNNVDIIVFEAGKGDCMRAVWTTLSVGWLGFENASNFFQCEIQTSRQNKNREGGGTTK